MVGGGDGDESFATPRPAEILQILAAHQAAHAEGDDADRLRGAEFHIDVLLEVGGEIFQSTAAVARGEAGDETLAAALFEAFLKRFEGGAGLHESVDEHHAMDATDWRWRTMGARGADHQAGGDAMEKGADHGLGLAGWP